MWFCRTGIYFWKNLIEKQQGPVLNCFRDWMRRILGIWYFQSRRVALGAVAVACFRLKRKRNLVFCAKRQATPQRNMGSCWHSFGAALAGALWRWVWDFIPRQETCAHSVQNLAPLQAVAKFPLISAMPGFHVSVPLWLFFFFFSPLSLISDCCAPCVVFCISLVFEWILAGALFSSLWNAPCLKGSPAPFCLLFYTSPTLTSLLSEMPLLFHLRSDQVSQECFACSGGSTLPVDHLFFSWDHLTSPVL